MHFLDQKRDFRFPKSDHACYEMRDAVFCNLHVEGSGLRRIRPAEPHPTVSQVTDIWKCIVHTVWQSAIEQVEMNIEHAKIDLSIHSEIILRSF